MSGVRVVPEDEIEYSRNRVVQWCSKNWPTMTLAQVQTIALLVALERAKAADGVVPRRERRVCMPITLPVPTDEENEVTEPRGKR